MLIDRERMCGDQVLALVLALAGLVIAGLAINVWASRLLSAAGRDRA
jgi:hypothetical protein